MKSQQRNQSRPVRVGIVVASLDIVGGHAVQALRLIEGLEREPAIAARLIPINPRLPHLLRWLQQVRHHRQSRWLDEWGRLKGDLPGEVAV